MFSLLTRKITLQLKQKPARATDRCFFFFNTFHFYCNLFCYLLTYLFTYLFFYFLLCINVVDLLSIKKERKKNPLECFPFLIEFGSSDKNINSKAVERFETWRAHLSLTHKHTPTRDFPKFPLRCSLSQANLFPVFTVSIGP